MGFTEYEKSVIIDHLVPLDKISEVRDNELKSQDYELLQFLKDQNYLRNIRDYAIIPKNHSRKNKFENIVVVKYFSSDFDFPKFAKSLLSAFTPPYTVKIDFNFTVSKPTEDEGTFDKYRFVWAQRSLAFEIKQKIVDHDDYDEFVNQLYSFNKDELLTTAYYNHQRQSCFDRSGYNKHRLIAGVLFLSKLGHSVTEESDYNMTF